MSLRQMVRRILLSLLLGGHAILGIGMSREQIEGLLSSMNETQVEVTVADTEKVDESPRS